MFIARDVGREISLESRSRRRMPLLPILWALVAFAVGALVAFLVVNRVLVHQMAVYGEGRMVQTSVILDLMDDLLPYLAGSMVAVSLLMVLALVAVLLSSSVSRWLRTSVLVLLMAVLALSGVVFLVGRGSDVRQVEPLQATPTMAAP